MSGLLLHPVTDAQLTAFVAKPGHALLLSGPLGAGKASVARQLAADLLAIDPSQLANYPYFKHIGDDAEKTIPIDAIRALTAFLTRKVPGNGKRIVIIEAAERLPVEAQNALLKTLEEPPTGTILLLTVHNEQALLPTIRSRAAHLTIARPSSEQIHGHFSELGLGQEQVERAELMSGGLPGLLHALLFEEDTSSLLLAAETAREVIRRSTFERLAMVDQLVKDKDFCLQVLAVLQQMAHVSLAQGRAVKNWQRILEQSYEAASSLLANVQPKLVLTNLMLNL